jgi:hypothetical protein
LLKYKIPLNENLFIEQTKLTFPYVYFLEHKKLKESKIITFLLFSIGIVIQFFGSDISTLFFAFGIFQFFNFYSKNENYKEKTNNHLRVIKTVFKENEQTAFGLFHFNEDQLRYSNELCSTWIKWDDFESYKIIKSHLLLFQKDYLNEIFVISESEVNEIEFQRIIAFIEEKIK